MGGKITDRLRPQLVVDRLRRQLIVDCGTLAPAPAAEAPLNALARDPDATNYLLRDGSEAFLVRDEGTESEAVGQLDFSDPAQSAWI